MIDYSVETISTHDLVIRVKTSVLFSQLSCITAKCVDRTNWF